MSGGGGVRVVATAMASALGYDVETACAAARAGLVRPGPVGLRTRSAVDGAAEEVSGHAARLLTDGFQDDARLVRLLQGAAADLARRAPGLDAADGVACYLSLPSASRTLGGVALVEPQGARDVLAAARDAAGLGPEPDGEDDDPVRAARLLDLAWTAAGWARPPMLAATSTAGHAGGAIVLARAARDLAEGRCDAAIVGGVDSWLDEDTLQWLLNAGRLKCDAHPAGFQPGEAAAFVVLARGAGAAAGPSVRAVHLADEPRSLLSGLPSFGEGLAQAMRGALDASASVPGEPTWLLTDLNGETHRAHEWGHALTRLRPGREPIAAPATTFPAASFGDVGAASVPLALCVALQAAARGRAPAGRATVVASSDGPARAAVALECPAPSAPSSAT